MTNKKQLFKKIWHGVLYFLLGFFVLILLLLIFINLPVGKRVVRNQVQSYLQNKLHAKVSIGAVDYSLPQWLKIKNVYIEDQKKDSLIYGEELSVDLNMIKLALGNTDIQKLVFKNILLNINRASTDSFFNYQFIIDAFTGNKSSTAIPDTAELKLSLDRLIFDNVGLKFKDGYTGTDFFARIKNLDATLNKFKPDRVNFGINNFYAGGVDFIMNTYKEAPPVILQTKIDSAKSNSTYGLYLTAKSLTLRDINVLINNKITRLYYANKITHLSLANALFNLEQSIGTADTVLLDSSVIAFSQPKKIAATLHDSPVVNKPWLFQANQLNIGSSQIKYDDNNAAAKAGLDFSHLDTRNLAVAASAFKFSKDTTRANISQFTFKDKSGFTLDTTHVNFLFTDTVFSATGLYVKTPHSLLQNSFRLKYDSVSAIKKNPQNSLIAATLNNSVIDFNDLFFLLPFLKTTFPPAQFANQAVNLNTELRGNLQRLYLPYIQLSGLSGSKLSARGTLYNLTDPNRFSYDLFIDQGNFLKRDILKFVPPANQQALAKFPDVFNLKGHLTGTGNNVDADINTTAKNFAFSGKVSLKNISNPANIQFTTAIQQASFDESIITGFIPPSVLQQINLPQKISIAGKLSGNSQNITADAKLGSSYGPLTVKGYIKNIQNPNAANYNLFITTPGFSIGKLIKQDTILGNVAGAFTAKGTGFNYKTMRSSVKADVASLEYNKYNYHHTLINADFKNGVVVSSGNINDSSLRLAYTLNADVSNRYPLINATLNVDTAQLQKLHLYKDTLNFSGHAIIQSKSLKPRSLDAALFLDNAKLQFGKNSFLLDTVSLIATSANGIDSINLKAPFADIRAGGAFDYDKVGVSLQQYISKYYRFPNQTSSAAAIADQQLAFFGTIKKSPVVTSLVPGLYDFDDINFSGNYTSANTDSALNFSATVPRLHYQKNIISKGAVDIASKNERINYAVKFDTLHTSSNVLYATSIAGAAAHDSIAVNAITKDNKNKDWFGISGDAFVKQDVYSFRLKNNLLLNYEKWNVAPDNYISYSDKGIIVNNFLINSDTAKISVKSRALIPGSPIDIDVANFNLKSISTLTSGDTLFAAGILNIDASVSDLDKPLPAFTGKASVNDLQILQHPVGNITASAEKQTENNIVAALNLLGNENDIAVKGNYYLNNEQKEFDAEVAVKKISLNTLEAFTAGSIKNASGNLHGQVTLQGKFTQPQWKGELDFDTTEFTLNQLGTPYKINNQKIVFDYPRIIFPQFIVTDSLDHKMKIDGYLSSNSLTDFDINLDINATDFILVNAPKAIENQFYGYAAVDANVSVTGNSSAPKIEGGIYVNDKSDITIVLPQNNYNKDDGKTVVRFIDRDTFNINQQVIGFEEEKKVAAGFADFLNYNLNLEINKNATLTVIVDPSTGDEIKVQGDARLNVGVDPGGSVVLAGTYELDNGYYDLHYQFLERKFKLIKGSTIIFGGTPQNAQVNIIAEYVVNTSAKDLLSNEVGNISPTLNNSFNQKLPFKVVLYLTGVISQPTINFNIQMPEQSSLLTNELKNTIENKLAQLRADPAATNKQVFSLLLLNRFVSEQSSDFFKGNGADFTDLARQSVSQFLSSALNEIAGDLFKGIDVDLNLNAYNDFTNGGNQQRTDLNIAVSKSFLDDRLTVSVGQNFGLQGQDAAAKAAGANTGFKPDVTIGYKLTRDGKYLLRAYTKNQFEVVLDGYVVETGVAFLVTMDYEKFRELFRRKK